MKKYLSVLFCTLGLSLSLSSLVLADELFGDENWHVTFNQNKEMVSNFSSDQFDDVLDNMQPGDSVRFQVRLYNNYQTDTDWYMTNEVLQSLEDESLTAKDGAYSYVLTYTDPSGQVDTLYNSEEVGGEKNKENLYGLHEATSALKDFFYLDTLRPSESGVVNLYVLLDGETQGNDYQDTLGRLKMNFAVELPVSGEGAVSGERIVYRDHDSYVVKKEADKVVTTGTPIVKTGDEMELVPVFIAAVLLGIILLILSIVAIRLRKKIQRGEKNEKEI